MLDARTNKPFEAVVLAGGFGTRLACVVSDVPKPMAPVVNRPFLEYVLDKLVYQGCERVVLATGHKAECIFSYFGNSYKNVELVYSHEIEPLGTGGAIKKALSVCTHDEVVVLNGDTLFDVDIQGLLGCLDEQHCSLALALRYVNDSSRYGAVDVESSKVRAFGEKDSHGAGYVSGGVYALKRNLLTDCCDKFSFESDFEQQYVDSHTVAAFISGGYFIDIGIPSDYIRAQEEFAKGYRRAAFFDRDGTINIDTGHLFELEKLEFIVGTPELIKSYNDKGYFVVVVTNQAGIAKGLYSEKEMHALHVELDRRLRTQWGAHIDAFHYCPHHPDFTGVCSCRKPEPGLIQEAVQMHCIDMARSVMYGDKESDEIAARHSGISNFIYIDEYRKGITHV